MQKVRSTVHFAGDFQALNLQKKGQEDLGHYLMRTKKEDQDPVREQAAELRPSRSSRSSHLAEQICCRFSSSC